MNTSHYRILILIYCLLAADITLAEGIEIQSAASRLAGDNYVLDARLEFNVDPGLTEALEHGVAIMIDVNIVIKRERNWLWDPTVKKETLGFRLEQHPLSNHYLVTNEDSGERQQFQNLTDALSYLGTINGHMLINKDILASDSKYTGKIKAEVNTETLPAVIRPAAAVSKKWQLNSTWFEWVIKE